MLAGITGTNRLQPTTWRVAIGVRISPNPELPRTTLSRHRRCEFGIRPHVSHDVIPLRKAHCLVYY
jgi:hypothetical protein